MEDKNLFIVFSIYLFTQAEENGAEGDDDEPRYVRDEDDEDDG